MDSNYLTILEKVTFTLSDIENLFNKAQSGNKSFENNEAYHIVENLIERLDIYKDQLGVQPTKPTNTTLRLQVSKCVPFGTFNNCDTKVHV